MSKTKLNYWIDVAIGVFFIASALSGLLLYFFPSGYQGGRNPYYARTILLLTTHQWSELHTWSSIGMIAGVGAHLVLHFKWMVCMTRKLFERPKARPQVKSCPLPAE
jgi:amino acid transporter